MIGKASLRGTGHQENEDSAVARFDNTSGWLVLIDGMTGHGAGELAALFAVFGGGIALVAEASPETALLRAHQAVCNLSGLGREGRPPGASGLAITIKIKENLLQGARVGDVRGYLWTPLKGLQSLFGEDHYTEKGVTRWLGQPGELAPEVIEKELPCECVLLFLTDGAWAPLGEDLLDQVVSANGGAQTIAERIVEWAHQVDDYDDATAVIVVINEEKEVPC